MIRKGEKTLTFLYSFYLNMHFQTMGVMSYLSSGTVRLALKCVVRVTCDIIIRMAMIYWALVPYYVPDTMFTTSHPLNRH